MGKKDQEMPKDSDKPISLYPLKPAEALRRFMQIDPKEYRKRRQKEELPAKDS